MATLLPPDVRTVAVVGCSKNAGKTTTLNALLASLRAALRPPGALSIGIDGEEADFWLGVPKPRIEVRVGDRIATAEAALGAGTAGIEIRARTGGRTLLGDLVIGEVREPGTVLLAGIRSKDDVRDAVAGLRALGADTVLVDGAYQRVVAADPEVSGGVVVATGAVLARTVDEVASRTAEFLARLAVPASDRAGDGALMQAAVRSGRLACLPDGGTGSPVLADAPDDADAGAVLSRGDVAMAVPGAVTDDLIRRGAAAASGRLRLLAMDATRLFVSPLEVASFRRRHDLRVIRPIRVLGLTVNPVSVLGWTLPLDALVAAVRGVSGGVPVLSFDVHPPPS